MINPVGRFTLDDIYSFLNEEIGSRNKELTPDVSLRDDLRVEGDDFFELEEAFAKRFNVDMSGYLWYFHHGEEPSLNIGGLFCAPPYKRVKSIPVTPQLLLESANKGKWSLDYPPHSLPPKRFDMIINGIIFLPSLLGLAYIGIKKLAMFFFSL